MVTSGDRRRKFPSDPTTETRGRPRRARSDPVPHAVTCHGVSQSGQVQIFQVGTNTAGAAPSPRYSRYSVFAPRSPEHAQTHRVPAIASPRILRPIHTHTPATGFPYLRTHGSTMSRIGAHCLSPSRPVSLALPATTSVQWYDSSPTSRVEAVEGSGWTAWTRKERPPSVLNRFREAELLCEYHLKSPPSNKQEQPSLDQSDRVPWLSSPTATRTQTPPLACLPWTWTPYRTPERHRVH